jgi:hypothetical protein
MLNPSTADHTIDDPTIRRCLGFARDWGYEAIEVVNLWSWRATDPTDVVRNLADAANSTTDLVTLEVARLCKTIVVAWGFGGGTPWGRERSVAVEAMLRFHGAELLCLGKTNNGSPSHPLYIPRVRTPVVYQSGDATS